MKLPFISSTEGNIISIRFPQTTRTDLVNIDDEKGNIMPECYTQGSPAKKAIYWAKKFPAIWSVSQREDGVYDVILKFEKLQDALKFKNEFMKEVHGKEGTYC